MIKAAKAEKRNQRLPSHVAGFLAGGRRTRRRSGIHGYLGRTNGHARQTDLVIDVTDAIRALPEAARFYCAMLMQDLPIRTLCKIHNRHPSTVYETMGRIRRDFGARDLQKYLH
jgi:undecaprenyl pyrophosphate synthase